MTGDESMACMKRSRPTKKSSHGSVASIITGNLFSVAKTNAEASSAGAFISSMVSSLPSALTMPARTAPEASM